ncbi:hypothetical protein BX666DRAFT_2031198 [Dichotomocladium elegans]|nr:hypothetical protein BX666DRAFT_2031198 [Dichotomocladium elegans]
MPLITGEMVIHAALKKARLIPDVIPSNFYPEAMLDIKYGNEQVTLGNELDAQTTATAPDITVIPPGNYTLLMANQCNNQGLPLGNVSRPDPSFGTTGPFVFLLYKQRHHLDKNTFDAQEFMAHEPLAGVNFFNIKT